MSYRMRAMIAPYSSVVGQSIGLIGEEGQVVAMLSVTAPAGPPPGEDHEEFVGRIAKAVALAINGSP